MTMDETAAVIPWASGSWTNPPAAVRADGDELLVTAVEGSDAWRHTSYGFVHDTEHWSVSPVPEWSGARVTIRASWVDDAITLRARAAGEGWRLVRVIPWELPSAAGPMICAPTRAGLEVRFHSWRVVEPDDALH